MVRSVGLSRPLAGLVGRHGSSKERRVSDIKYVEQTATSLLTRVLSIGPLARGMAVLVAATSASGAPARLCRPSR